MKLNKKFKVLTILFAIITMTAIATVSESKVSANMYYFELFGGAPLQQDWNDTTQITVNDDWSNVISIQGFLGENLTTTPGVDPQTITANGQNVIDVNANQTDPNSFLTGGVTEFEITDPTVALRATDTENAPHLMVYLNTTPCPATKSISIRYSVRDLDSSSRDSFTSLALQYRVGTTAPFTNIPAGFIPDATEPNAATKVTSKLVKLPQAIIQQPMVEVRLITANAPGDDEAIGIDDIEVGCFFPTVAGVSAGGRVVTQDETGIYNANVSIYNTFTQERRWTRTTNFGYFNFDDLEAGGLYIINISHRTHRFSVSSQTFELHEDRKDLVFFSDNLYSPFKRKGRNLKR